VAYVDVTQHPDETLGDARQRRREELERGWRFACNCPKCFEDGDGTATPYRDESKLGEVVSMIEQKAGDKKSAEEVE